MKKIALFIALFAGFFTSAMAQDTKDSVYVVQGDTAVTAFAISDGDYITFTRPEVWHNVVTDASTYFYFKKAYTYDFTYKTTIQQLGTQNYFYVTNFLNSGSGFTFKIKNTDGTYDEEITDINSKDGIFEAVNEEGTSVSDYGAYSGNSYYAVFDDGTSAWSWKDTVNGVTWTSFYWYGGDGYATFKGTEKYIEVSCCPEVNGSYCSTVWSTLYIDWR